MSFKDVEVVLVADPDNGEKFEAVRVPEGFYLCLITQEMADRYAEWSEAKAVRIKTDGEFVASLDVTNDEDWVTGPESADA